MRCPSCGDYIAQDNRFCLKCGKEIGKADPVFCMRCGRRILTGNAYCTGCGKPLGRLGQTASHAVTGSAAQPVHARSAQPPVPRSYEGSKGYKAGKAVGIAALVLVPLALAALAGLVVLAVLVFRPGERQMKRLELGDTRLVGSATIGVEGGSITVDAADSDIDGLTISVPGSAYTSDTYLDISVTEITGHNYGEAFASATPLITVENGGVFYDAPLEVVIPIELSDDEFAMAFYYDRETGELEGMPLISQDSGSITVMTQHFSEFVVSKVKKGRIVDEVDSGFRPGTDDFQMANHGSVLCKGHCAGQSIAAIYYYYNHGRIGWDQPLYGLFDNNGGSKTPDFWQDDAREVRMCSALQKAMSGSWSASGQELQQYFRLINADDELTYYAVAYTMQLSGKPQFMYIRQSGGDRGAHALIAYRVTADSIYVSDPNKPGDTNRKINFSRGPGMTPMLMPYGSGYNADAMAQGESQYDEFGYFGVFALVNKSTCYQYWSEVFDNMPVAAPLFPSDINVDVALSLDANGNTVTQTLADGLVVTAAGTASFGEGVEGMLCCRVPAARAGTRLSLYVGTTRVGEITAGWLQVALMAGSNDIGVLQEELAQDSTYRFVNFNRYNVIYGDSATPLPTQETTVPATQTPVEQSGAAGLWSDVLVTTGEGGHIPIKCLNDALILSINDGQGTMGSTMITLENGIYSVGPVIDTFDVNTIAVSGTSVAITRQNSSTGSTLLLSGALSADGNTIEGTFVLTFGSDTSNYKSGTWISTRMQ